MFIHNQEPSKSACLQKKINRRKEKLENKQPSNYVMNQCSGRQILGYFSVYRVGELKCRRKNTLRNSWHKHFVV